MVITGEYFLVKTNWETTNPLDVINYIKQVKERLNNLDNPINLKKRFVKTKNKEIKLKLLKQIQFAEKVLDYFEDYKSWLKDNHISFYNIYSNNKEVNKNEM